MDAGAYCRLDNDMNYLKNIKKYYYSRLFLFNGRPVGCKPDEVDELERQVGFPLPEAYKQYLLWMGKDYNGIFSGSDWFVDNLLKRTEWLPDLLEENGIDYKLPEHYLVFFAHQGYMMAWFELPMQNDNPPAYFFGEGQNLNAPRLEGTFTDVLLKDMRGLAHYVTPFP